MNHEKIVLVVLSYVIGFTTAFIAFGLSNDELLYRDLEIVKAEPLDESIVSEEGMQITLKQTERGFFAVVDGSERVISGKLQPTTEVGPGFHVSIPFAEISPTGEYVYYCEQETTNEESCKEYIYSVDEHIKHPLRYEGDRLVASISHSDFSWKESGLAEYDSFTSQSVSEPWLLITQN